MAKCWKCDKRCRADVSCAWCGRRPMCLSCKCSCKKWEETPTTNASGLRASEDGTRTTDETR